MVVLALLLVVSSCSYNSGGTFCHDLRARHFMCAHHNDLKFYAYVPVTLATFPLFLLWAHVVHRWWWKLNHLQLLTCCCCSIQGICQAFSCSSWIIYFVFQLISPAAYWWCNYNLHCICFALTFTLFCQWFEIYVILYMFIVPTTLICQNPAAIILLNWNLGFTMLDWNVLASCIVIFNWNSYGCLPFPMELFYWLWNTQGQLSTTQYNSL